MRTWIKRWIGLAALLGAASSVAAQDDAPEALTFAGYEVRQLGDRGTVEVATQAGREELVLTRASVLLEGLEFSEGVIEFDLAFKDERGFGGLIWHTDAAGANGEYFYIRQHKSGLPDAGQYTPFRGGLTSWQIYTDRNALAEFAHAHEGWNRIKFVIEGDRADIYYNGSSTPILHVPDLASDRGSGFVGFRTSGPNGQIRFANLTVRPLAPGEGIVGTSATDTRTAPNGTITRWAVSEHFAEDRIAGQLALPADLTALPARATLETESFGIVDLSRSGTGGPDDDTALVSTRITADRARRVRLAFGYSDRVRLFLNGELVFDGSAGWRSRDYFFLGTIGFNDAVVLNLREGENVLTAAVSETFGGWGFAAAIADGEGLAISP